MKKFVFLIVCTLALTVTSRANAPDNSTQSVEFVISNANDVQFSQVLTENPIFNVESNAVTVNYCSTSVEKSKILVANSVAVAWDSGGGEKRIQSTNIETHKATAENNPTKLYRLARDGYVIEQSVKI